MRPEITSNSYNDNIEYVQLTLKYFMLAYWNLDVLGTVLNRYACVSVYFRVANSTRAEILCQIELT